MEQTECSKTSAYKNSEAGELPRRKHRTYRTRRKFEIKVCNNCSFVPDLWKGKVQLLECACVSFPNQSIYLVTNKEAEHFKNSNLSRWCWQVSVATVTCEQLLNLLKYDVFDLKLSCYAGWNTLCCYCGLSGWLPSCRPVTICRCCSVSGFMFTEVCGVVGSSSGTQTEGTRLESRLKKRLSCISSSGKILYLF